MSTLPAPSELTRADAILFRPSKKRKIYRQRIAQDEPDPSPTAPSISSPDAAPAQSLDELISTASASLPSRAEEVPVPMSEILRLRKKSKARGGVEFKASGQVARNEEAELVLKTDEEGLDTPAGVQRKFAPQTGTVGDVNKHMMAYIDSELAKRRGVEGSHASLASPGLAATAGSSAAATGSGSASGHARSKGDMAETQRQPATIGKLQEIDLGDEARNRNIERTNNARRRLGGEVVEESVGEDEGGRRRKKKVRLNRDGSVWVPRKRRGSDDIKRDQLVEAVLRENRLEIYEEPPPEPRGTDDDQAADDRIAEAFRRDFLDAVSQKQRKKPASSAAAVRGPGAKKEELMRGPKLGGSRSARAAMREAMLKK
ncbi:hypothetical protein B2J93_7719 [Marssonina coronariae]|uniref:mRNA splicing factor RNA helicase n=1 Tax=Diplocarpon coronariae TaxID=2795749 RepID=A0A218ZI33_9HELO|nr:hypothetical protein B2J93_7719 [Marssonina coronariae]